LSLDCPYRRLANRLLALRDVRPASGKGGYRAVARWTERTGEPNSERDSRPMQVLSP